MLSSTIYKLKNASNCFKCQSFILNIQAIRWAKSGIDEEAKEKSELAEGKILRSKLGAALHLIRFSTMSAKEFFEFVGKKNTKSIFNFYSSQIQLAYLMQKKSWMCCEWSMDRSQLASQYAKQIGQEKAC